MRRGDGELCGYVLALERGGSSAGGWSAQVVFGVEIGRHASEAEARQHVETRGLSILAERWQLDPGEEIVLVQQADPDGVQVALGPYSIPGVPQLRISRAELESGRWTLTPPA